MSRLFERPGSPGSTYEAMRTSNRPSIGSIRDRLEAMWTEYEPYADRHFLEQFRREINARYWEMYVTCCLIENGVDVSSATRGPDVCIDVEGVRVWVEAVGATQGNVKNRDRPPDFEPGTAIAYPDEQVLLRYRSSIEAKVAKRKEYVRNGIMDESDVYVVAINAGGIPYAFIDDKPPHILGALYAIGPDQVKVAIPSGKTLWQGNAFRPSITRIEGAQVRTDIFLDPAYSGISGVIYSGANAWNTPPKMGHDLIFVPNIMAASPVPDGLYPFRATWRAVRQGDGLKIEMHESRE